ncbi:MAG: ammonium transporter [Chloracidobacterium sp.]|uniref:Ammonium transporter n=1 Tax=Chloracidobacterium validum TaxID=2821543 RepID=A0ABX8B9F0_9BACT|nr:ammonium transporter [Chloracidobacterium validum]QUW03062.1 ammonium transporter [Chloracidobacterium validum]
MNETGISAGDTAWLLVSAALVFLMTPGLAFFYGGLVNRRHVLNTLMMAFGALCVAAVMWVLVGYSLAFAPGGALVGGLTWAGFQTVGDAPQSDYAATVPHLAFAAFQGMFAVITPALIAGAVVGRMDFRAYLLFVALWCVGVYAPVAHWVWGLGGWIRASGALDFAGGTVVHITAGSAALVAAALVGARADVTRSPLRPHNVPFVLLGAGLLWFGWFGFNAGSALTAGGLASLALVTTHLSAAAAVLVWLGLETIRTGKATAVGAATAAVVGLVGITPAAGFVSPLAALAIGGLTAAICYAAIQWRSRLALDDTLDVFACHGVGGICGALLTGIFAQQSLNAGGADGLLAGNPKLLLTQLIAVVATLGYTLVATFMLLKLVGLILPLRLSLAHEMEGIDRHAHGETAYHETTGDDVFGLGAPSDGLDPAVM